jgi:CubicO group peptidase (beta-lactamase class C family)
MRLLTAIVIFISFFNLQCSKQVEAICDASYRPDVPGGYAIAVIKDGKVEFKKSYGFSNSEHDVPFTSSTVFDFASVAKQFTGFGIAILVEQGRLSLDDDIRKYLPKVADFGEKITIRHLLYHTSGIRDWVGLVKLSGRYKTDVITDDFLMEIVEHQKELNFKPGERFQYSNTGYFLLAQIISRVTNQSFREWTDENIFGPLSMNNTHFSDDYTEIIRGRASSYKRSTSDSFSNNPSNLTAYGSSSLFSTLDDMVKWVMNFEERSIGGDNVWTMMLEKGELNNNESVNYGFGISFGDYQGIRNYGHGGSWGGCVCQLTYFPDQQFGFIFISNRDPSGVYVDNDVFSIYLGDTTTVNISSGSEAITLGEVNLDPNILEEYVGYYMHDSRVIKVEMVNKNLILHLPWESNVRIHAESVDTFFLKNVDVKYSFKRDEEGNVSQLTIHAPSGDFPHGRIDSRVSDCEEIEGFCGEYYSNELRTSYEIKIEDGRLIADHLHNEDVSLIRLDNNHYIGDKWWFSDIELNRDENNEIEGFRLNADQNNIQDLLWTKK